MCARTFFLLLNLLFCTVSPAQEYNYQHYDLQDGLAGSTVYNMYQDKEGFMWIATETGVSRFDGTHFKKFTVRDGLPDNTIIRIYGDTRGRIWLLPLTNTVCYYYQGKIYNQHNDPLLKKIVLDDYVNSITENKRGELFIQGPSHIYRLSPNDSLEQLVLPAIVKKRSLNKIAVSDSGDLFVQHTFKLYKFNAQQFTYLLDILPHSLAADHALITDKTVCWVALSNRLYVRSLQTNKQYSYTIPPANTLYHLNDSVIVINSIRGSHFFNLLQGRIEKTYLPNKNISRCLPDRAGGLWFSTFDDGIYYLSSSLFRNTQYEVAKGQHLSVYDLAAGPGGVWAASDMGYIQVLKQDSLQILSLAKQYKQAVRGNISCIARRGNLMAMGIAEDIFVNNGFSAFKHTNAVSTPKDIVFNNDQELLVAGSNRLYTLRIDKFVFNVLWEGRTTCLFRRNDSVYFGAYNGLYVLKPDKQVVYLGATIPLLKNRIAAIREGGDGTLWIATYNKGLIGLQNNKVRYHLTEENGLSSDACRCLATDGQYLWAGTSGGLNRISLHAGRVSIDQYVSDGPAPDLINAVLVYNDTVYAGTPKGITSFYKNSAPPSAGCDFKMLDITINGKETPITQQIRLGYGYNSIRLDYVAISFAAAGHITYSWRLRDLDTAWQTTTQTRLEFISLPPGEHQLEIYGTNKFGVSSNRHQLMISIQRPFWQTAWFIIACIMTIILATWVVVSSRNRQARKKEADRRAIEQQLQGLEQKALRAQMNPHFIFNCMNSIQEFILDKDIASANKYLSRFAHLIRQTLNNSLQPSTTLADEIKYLTNYLNLEQMRFNNRFQYDIRVNSGIQPEQVHLPVMLLQPYVENAIRHGMQGNNPDGQIDINFSLEGPALYCRIKDNGIGREAAGKVRQATQLLYPSRGMQLTNERIALMNKHAADAITVEIQDLKDGSGNATGTAVIIRIPITNNL